MSTAKSLSNILSKPTTIHFIPNTQDADFGDLDLKDNPHQSADGFIWHLPDNKELVITFVGKVAYSVLGDKTGPYFNLVDSRSPLLGADELKKAKVGFAIRLINTKLSEDQLESEELVAHNLAVFVYLDEIRDASNDMFDKNPPKSPVEIRPFLKKDGDKSFFIIPIVSPPIFPQFKGKGPTGVIRAKGQAGKARLSLDPNEPTSSSLNTNDPTRLVLGKLPDPQERFQLTDAQRLYEMVVPPVFTDDGKTVLPGRYQEAIPENTLVAVRGTMKAYQISGDDKTNRPYLITFQRMQVIGPRMTSWDIDPKKRPLDSPRPGPSKRAVPTPSGSQSRDEVRMES